MRRYVWYVWPQWHRVSFSLIAEKHLRYIKRYVEPGVRIESIDELAFPHIDPHTRPLVVMHPYFFMMVKFAKRIARRLHQYAGFVGIDVADSDHISNLAVSMTNYAEAMIVPSTFAKRAYERSGVTVPVYVVPHGLDVEWYTRPSTAGHYFADLLRLKRERNLKYILFFLWHSAYRKGWDLVIEFYRRLRMERKDVVMVLKTYGPDSPEARECKRYGCIHVYGWLTDEQKMELFDLADLYPLFTRGGGFECVPPDTIVVAKDGIKTIKDVKVGDEVLTHAGRFMRVVRVFKRRYKGKLVKIVPYGFENIGIELTPEHPVLVLRTSRFKSRKRELVLSEKPVWIRADEVKPGDAVLVPIPRVNKSNIVFDLADFIRDDIESGVAMADEEYVYYVRTGSPRFTTLSYKDIERLTGESKKIVCEAVKCYITGDCPRSPRVQKVVEFLRRVDYKPEYVKVKRFVKLDKALAKVIGYYLSEGYVNENNWAVEFSFGDEPEIVNDLVNAIVDAFGYIPSVIKYHGKKLTKVVVCNKAIAKMLLKLCGKGAGNKRIPPELLFADREVLSWAIWSMILGDGSVDSKKLRYVTKSRDLAFGMYVALVRLGYKPRILYHKGLRQWHIEVTIPPDVRTSITGKQPDANILRPRSVDYVMHSNKMFMDHARGFMILLVKRVEMFDYDGEVYNLEVEGDNSYTANMIAVHNCNGLEAIARLVPTIAARGGSWEDYLPPWALVESRQCPYVLKDNPIHDGRGVEVIVEKAVDKAHVILDNLDEYRARLAEWRERVLKQRFEWSVIAKRLYSIIRDVLDRVR
jgi:intein/homing endonuclease/glycosyltransferase involved in cell wall biosynthesis